MRLKIIAPKKSKVEVESDVIMKNAVFSTPMSRMLTSSLLMSSHTSGISKGANRAEQEIRMDFIVLPAACLNFLYWRTLKHSPRFSSSMLNSSSSSLT